LLGVAVILTFTRSFWVQAGLATLLLFFLIEGGYKKKFLFLSLIVLWLAIVALAVVFSEPESRISRSVMATAERLFTLGDSETIEEDSLQWRYVENSYVLDQFLSHPLFGIGLGARYRPFDARLDQNTEEWDARRYIHNAHFWILLKTGLVGYVCLMGLSIVFLIRGFKYWPLISDSRFKAYVLGFTLTYLGVPLGALVNPIFMQWYWTPVIGMIMGINEVVLRKVMECQEKSDPSKLRSIIRQFPYTIELKHMD
jgi:O-antigen ligase